jgi:preprotein translocase subunit SecA
MKERIVEQTETMHTDKTATVGEQVMRHFEKAVMLQVLDQQWKDHLAAMDHLRQGIHLRGYAQKNPKQEYKRESFEMFSELLDRIKREVIGIVSRVQIRRDEEVQAMEAERQRQAAQQTVHYEHPAAPGETEVSADSEEDTIAATGTDGRPMSRPVVRNQPKIGRNDPCPCGSGKKYKQCHGKLA